MREEGRLYIYEKEDEKGKVRIWQDRNQHARRLYEEKDRRDREIVQRYMFEMQRDKRKRPDKVSINEIFHYVSIYLTQFTRYQLEMFMVPKRNTEEARALGHDFQNVMQHYIQEKDMISAAKDCVKQSSMRRWSVAKIGFDGVEPDKDLMDQTRGQLLKEFVAEKFQSMEEPPDAGMFRQMMGGYIQEANDEIDVMEAEDNYLTHQTIMRHGMDMTGYGPWIYSCAPESVVIDPHCRLPKYRRWAIERLELTPKEAHDDYDLTWEEIQHYLTPRKRYIDEGSYYMTGDEGDNICSDPDSERIYIYECWDCVNREVSYVMDGRQEFVKPPRPYAWSATELLDPYIFLIMVEGDESWNHLNMWEGQTKLIDLKNDMLSSSAESVTKNPSGMTLMDDSLPKEAQYAIRQPNRDKVLGVKVEGGKRLGDMVWQARGTEMSSTSFNIMRKVDDELQRGAGISHSAQGHESTQGDRKTATQIVSEDQSRADRNISTRSIVGQFFHEIFTGWAQLIMENDLPYPILEKILGPERAAMWPDWTKEEIRNMFRFRIDTSETLRRPPELEKAYFQDFQSYLMGLDNWILGIYMVNDPNQPNPIASLASANSLLMSLSMATIVAKTVWGISEDSEVMQVMKDLKSRCRQILEAQSAPMESAMPPQLPPGPDMLPPETQEMIPQEAPMEAPMAPLPEVLPIEPREQEMSDDIKMKGMQMAFDV